MGYQPRLQPRYRIAIAIAVAAAAGALVLFIRLHGMIEYADFDQIWIAARALHAGGDPYLEVAKRWGWPLYYPLPAVLLAVPLTGLRVEVADAVFVAVSAGLFAYAVSAEPFLLAAIVSQPFVYALERGQWSPLIVAVTLLPSLGFALAAKPTVGAALFCYRPTWRAFLLAVAFAALSVAILPRWPFEWVAATRNAPHVRAPITYSFGPVVLVALLRWRRPEARLILALACVPQTFTAYETLPLFLVPRTLREMLVLMIGAICATYAVRAISPPSVLSVTAGVRLGAPYLLAGTYLPALVMLLRRPNCGPAPAVVDRWLGRAPQWLVGSPDERSGAVV